MICIKQIVKQGAQGITLSVLAIGLLMLTAASCNTDTGNDEGEDSNDTESTDLTDSSVVDSVAPNNTDSASLVALEDSDKVRDTEQEAFAALDISEVKNDLARIAAWYCLNMEQDYYFDHNGPARCILSDGTDCDSIFYYIGKCAPEKSACGLLGYDIAYDMDVYNLYGHSTWVSCIVNEEKVSIFEVMEQLP